MYLPSHSVIMSRLFIRQNRTIIPLTGGFIVQNYPIFFAGNNARKQIGLLGPLHQSSATRK